ncbi:DUF4190 domain-containing protein [Salinispora mooreana]|uniref:DUF4190 domain-containing protein n=1 Tax=Salinispora mooreana TaxID=999545 RepID=UPI00039D35DB|nr:DUF4190 domain-containing protein [Salinispora mooreana]
MSQPPSPGPPDPDRPVSPWEQPNAGPEPSPSYETGPNQPLEHGTAQGSQPQSGQQQWEQQQHWGQQPQWEQQQHWGQQPQWEQQQHWGQQPHHLYAPPQSPPTNILAVLSLVFAFVFAPAGIVLGHVARRQLRTSGESGGQLATVGLVLSYIFTVLGLLACCGLVFVASAPIPGSPDGY